MLYAHTHTFVLLSLSTHNTIHTNIHTHNASIMPHTNYSSGQGTALFRYWRSIGIHSGTVAQEYCKEITIMEKQGAL